MVIHNSKELFNVSFGKKPILIMFPFGGGNTFSYRGMVEQLEDTFDIVCTELPGRHFLSGMPLENNMLRLVEFVYSTWISPLNLNRPYIFFGHSMGALIAYLITKELSRRKKKLPIHLVVSGRAAPSVSRKSMYHTLPSPEFFSVLEEMGGMSKELLENDGFREYFEPIFRSDFAAVETYIYTVGEQLEIPITVWTGTRENITENAAQAWQNETTVPLSFERMEGNHFFIFEHIPYIVSSLKSMVRSTVELPRTNVRVVSNAG
ncbi:MAG: thioesterase domain-containing protein [Bacteroides sp.]|nr:thioesterase domain-containing protein [Bacteroides sp.]